LNKALTGFERRGRLSLSNQPTPAGAPRERDTRNGQDDDAQGDRRRVRHRSPHAPEVPPDGRSGPRGRNPREGLPLGDRGTLRAIAPEALRQLDRRTHAGNGHDARRRRRLTDLLPSTRGGHFRVYGWKPHQSWPERDEFGTSSEHAVYRTNGH